MAFRNYMMPCTVSFISAPAAFNPAQYTASYPVINSSYINFGDLNNPLPIGDYVVKITDSCGNSSTQSISIGEGGLPEVSVNGDGACFYYIGISVPNQRKIVAASIISAPDDYPASLPQDVLSHASGGYLNMAGFLPGDYVFRITDECGNEYVVNVTVVGAVDNQFYVLQGPGCIPGLGSIMLYINSSQLSTVKITSAPAAFSQSLPFDVSNNIKAGVFYMNLLPAGIYTLETLDLCGNPRTGSVTVNAYQPANDPVAIVYNCGSFDIDLHDTTNDQQFYYLQKFNETSGKWVNPLLGIENDGILLTNNSIMYNLTYKGKFRIIRQAYYYGNGSDAGYPVLRCETEIYNFEFQEAPVILGAYAFPCSNGLSEVIIDAAGAPPLSYAITLKNGEPYLIDNGTDFVFTQLENGVYNFSVTDNCGNIVNIKYDITNLKPLAIDQKGFCEGEDSSLFTKSYSFLTYQWWKEGAPGTILSTTYTLNLPSFASAVNGGKYFLKIVSTTPGSCIDTVLEYTIELPAPAFSGEDNTVTLCDSENFTDLSNYLSEGHDEGGNWEDTDGTGGLAGSMLNLSGLDAGMYHFTYITVKCGIQDEAIITIDYKGPNSFVPDLKQDCVDYKHILSIKHADDIPGIAVVWSGPDGFTAEGPDADVTGMPAGLYYAMVKNASGCTSQVSVTVDAAFCDLPKGVSPNGDGKNDTFDLTNLNLINLHIFNRYGLSVYKANNYKNEWHGQTDGGKSLPTGVYYYAATLQSGKQVTGWVYLNRQE